MLYLHKYSVKKYAVILFNCVTEAFCAALTRQVFIFDLLFFCSSDLKVLFSNVNADKQFYLQKKITSAFLKVCHLHMQNMNLCAVP